MLEALWDYYKAVYKYSLDMKGLKIAVNYAYAYSIF